MLLTSLAALAAEPVIHTYEPTGLGEPIWAPCPIPPVERPDDPTPKERPAEKDFGSWPELDLAVGGGNPALLARAQARVDLGALPVEPLRGAQADLAAVRAVWKKTGLIRVAIAGDSHTFWDGIPGQLRRVLQSRYGDGGPGFLMPLASNGALEEGRAYSCKGAGWTLKVFSRRLTAGLGPSATVLTTSAATTGGWLELWETPEPKATMTASILYFSDTKGGTLEVVVDHASPVVVPTRGDPGPAVARVGLPVGPHHLGFTTRGDGPVSLAGVVVERAAPAAGVVVDAIGSGGRPLTAWSSWDTTPVEAWSAQRPYDLVLLSGGSADLSNPALTEADFRTQTRDALQAFRKVFPSAACVLLGPADRGHRRDGGQVVVYANHAWANRVLRELAPEVHCVTWDLQAAMGGEGSATAWYEAGLMGADLLHLTPAGYHAVADRLLAQLDPR